MRITHKLTIDQLIDFVDRVADRQPLVMTITIEHPDPNAPSDKPMHHVKGVLRTKALKERVLKACQYGDGMTLGVLFNRLRADDREDIKTALAQLVDEGRVLANENFHQMNHTRFIRYQAINPAQTK